MGCGWGALDRYLAGEYGVDVTGVTLSEEQVRWGNERARAVGLADRTRFRSRTTGTRPAATTASSPSA